MSRFNSGGDPYRVTERTHRNCRGEQRYRYTFFSSFSCYHEKKYRLELRCLLMYHFALGFYSLSGKAVVSCCANKIQRLCLYKGERKEDKPTPVTGSWHRAYRTKSAILISIMERTLCHSQRVALPMKTFRKELPENATPSTP